MSTRKARVGISVAAVAILLLFFESYTYAQAPSISFSGVPLQLGMSRGSAMVQLKKYYTIKSASGDSNSLLIMSKDGPPYQFIANIAFKNEKISHIRKYWQPAYEGSDSGPFFKAFFALLSKLQEEGYTVARVSTAKSQEPTGTLLYITLMFGKKSISIGYDEGIVLQGQKLPPSVTLDEILE